jgi:hypothetical protein
MKTKTACLMLAMMATLAGCTLTQPAVRKDGLPNVLGSAGQLITPKRCVLTVAIAARPVDDAALRDALWSAADCQAISDDVRQALAHNGIQVGVVTGDLPGSVQAILDAPPPNKINPSILMLNDGEGCGVPTAGDLPELELMMSRHGKVVGKVYKDAKGQLRISASQAGESGVKVRIVPELHHGPVRQGWQAAPGGGAFAPHSFVSTNGQEQESFRELAAELTLRPGQVAVMGTVPDRTGSLGAFLFTVPDGASDRLLQKVVFLWATRADGVSNTAEHGVGAPANLKEAEPPEMPARPSVSGDSSQPATKR